MEPVFWDHLWSTKLHERGAAEAIVPRSDQYDLVKIDAVRQLLADTMRSDATGDHPVDVIIHLAARGRHWCQSSSSS